MRAVLTVVAFALVVLAIVVLRDPELRARVVHVGPTPVAAGASSNPEVRDGLPAQVATPASIPAVDGAAGAAGTAGPPAAMPVSGPVDAPAAAGAPAPTTTASSSVATAGAAAAAAPPPASGATLSIPVQGVTADQLANTFGDARSGDRVHEALDIMAPAGTPVLAVADGHVEKLFDSDRGGLTIYQFDPDGRHAYYYAHLQAYATGLAEKQAITRGQLLGYVGSTGNADPAAPHLHFAVFVLGPEKRWWEGTPVNPYPMLRGP